MICGSLFFLSHKEKDPRLCTIWQKNFICSLVIVQVEKRKIDFISLYISLQRALGSFNDQAGC